MSLASIQKITNVEPHSNADTLDIVQVLNYKCIVRRGDWKVNDLCIFIEPDSKLPEVPWTAMYRARSNRVKAIKLRGVFSFGIVESFKNTNYQGPIELGLDISDALGIEKWEAPIPQDLSASGPYQNGIPKTDERRWQSCDIPYGEIVDVTLKIDGQSFSAIYQNDGNGNITKAVGGRSFLYKLDCINNYTLNEQKYKILDKLERFCIDNKVNLCIRGEQFGAGIQKSGVNPHYKLPLNLALFSTWLIDERRYARKGDPYYIFNIAEQLGLPTVPVLEKDVILTPELIKKYDEDLESLNGVPFEGVVINGCDFSFKVINKFYDSRK